MNIEKKLENGVLTLAVGGRLDTNTSPELEAEVNTDGVSQIVFDFAALEYISSAGLRLVLALHKQSTETGNKLVIRNVNKVVAEIFKVSGFDKALKVV